MRRVFTIGMALVFISFSTLFAQLEENIWMFGYHAGLDFSVGPPTALQSSMTQSTGEASATVSDQNGQLLFYTDGSYVWDRNHNLMPNGSNLTGLTPPGSMPITSSSSQGALIVPYPEQDSVYYIFSLTNQEMAQFGGRLYYSIVDMRLNNGLGDVVPGSKGIFVDSMLTESVTASVGDRCNVWVFSQSLLYQELRVYEVTAAGLNTNAVVSVFPGSSYLAVSNDRQTLAINGDRVRLYDFDPIAGLVSNPVTLSSGGYGLCFSPDDTKLYTTTLGSADQDAAIYQYDISSGDSLSIEMSKTLIGYLGTRFTSYVKRAVNGKLYFLSSLSPNAIGVINQPNLPGTACGFTPDVVSPVSGTRFSMGLPNVVPVIPHDTFLTGQAWSAGCFAVETSVRALDTSTGWDYVWSTGVTGMALTVDTPGTYWVSYRTPPCNYHVDTFHVRFPLGVLPDIYTHAACRSDSNGAAYATTYPGDPVDYEYTWMRGPDTLSVTDTLSGVPSGGYSLHVQTNTGCDTLLFFDMPEADFRVSFAISDTLICVGDTIRLTNTSDGHFTAFHWAMGNGDSFTVSDPSSYVYSQSGAYRIMLAGTGEICKDTAYQTFLVDQPLVPVFEARPKEVCVGQPVYFYPATDSTTVQLVWEMDEQLRVESDLEHRYQHGFTSSGTFPITLNLQSRACPDTRYTNSVRVYPFPEVDLGGDSSICLHGQPVYLKNLRGAPLSPYQQVWSTGDTTDVLKVVHPGVYTLSVTAGPIGCTTTGSVTIAKDCYVDIPNVFTPDGDGYNDYFFPRQLLSESVSRLQMQVFNRWGQLVFETNNINGRGWDGRLKAKVQPMGVYLYRIDVDFSNGRQEHYEGNVTLLR